RRAFLRRALSVVHRRAESDGRDPCRYLLAAGAGPGRPLPRRALAAPRGCPPGRSAVPPDRPAFLLLRALRPYPRPATLRLASRCPEKRRTHPPHARESAQANRAAAERRAAGNRPPGTAGAGGGRAAAARLRRRAGPATPADGPWADLLLKPSRRCRIVPSP